LQLFIKMAAAVAGTAVMAHHHIDSWYEENKANFSPPVCNKLMHKGQLSIMFVGGPNTRKDFHLEEGSEFFYQLKGHMELPTVQNGKRVLVKIPAGHVFLLPSRIPHSPQRPVEGSLGLVIERERLPDEQDALIFFEDFETCDSIQWEEFFRCNDLGKDLPPVIGRYKEWLASRKADETQKLEEDARPIRQNRTTEVPAPFPISEFLAANSELLAKGGSVLLFGEDHPDKEIRPVVVGGPSEQKLEAWTGETWLMQLRGAADIRLPDGVLRLEEGCCCTVRSGTALEVSRPEGSIGMVVKADSMGNKL
jgi:3-hydroxyanthranilate 3,4-dioxygenase